MYGMKGNVNELILNRIRFIIVKNFLIFSKELLIRETDIV